MAHAVRPADAAELCDVIADAVASGEKLAISGGGTKAPIGRDTPEATLLDMTAFTGIVDYDPAELVLTVEAGTPLAEVQALVAAEGQRLAFDPFDHAPLLGTEPRRATIGGTVAASVAGPLRLSGGGARDHLLGFEAVSGRAEHFVAGGRVVKNVTGYDVSKLIAGSWGRLAAVTRLTLKVLPSPRVSVTLLLAGLSPAAAVAAMARAMGSPAEVAAAAHLPDASDGPLTALRIHGFPASVAARTAMLAALLADTANVRQLPADDTVAFWQDIALAAPLPRDLPLWRIIVQPRHAPALVATLDGRWLMDWAGGLVWLASDADPAAIRATAAAGAGHATLVRADSALRGTVPALHPQPAANARLEERVRRAFDPAGVFETGRF